MSISTRTRDKIDRAHGIDEQEVRDAVVCVRGLEVRYDEHPTRGFRAIISCRIRQRLAAVVLYPCRHPMGDAWNLGSAYFVD